MYHGGTRSIGLLSSRSVVLSCKYLSLGLWTLSIKLPAVVVASAIDNMWAPGTTANLRTGHICAIPQILAWHTCDPLNDSTIDQRFPTPHVRLHCKVQSVELWWLLVLVLSHFTVNDHCGRLNSSRVVAVCQAFDTVNSSPGQKKSAQLDYVIRVSCGGAQFSHHPIMSSTCTRRIRFLNRGTISLYIVIAWKSASLEFAKS